MYKTYQYKILASISQKKEIDNTIFIVNQVRNYLISLFDSNSFIQEYLDKDYEYILSKGKSKGNKKTTQIFTSAKSENGNSIIFLKDKKKLRDIINSKLKKYLQDRKISISPKNNKIKLSKPIQLIVETFLNDFNNIYNSSKKMVI